MKIDSKPSIVQIEPAILNNLVREVKETLATDIKMPEPKKRLFTAVDMWKIRSTAKTAQGRFSR